MKIKQRVISLLLVLSMVLSMSMNVFATVTELPKQGDSLKGKVVILHTNDIHGRVTRNEKSTQFGFSAISNIKKSYEAAGATVILLDAGDTLHGLPFATLNKGADVVNIMNMIGYDAMTPGNHDFNYGSERLVELEKEMKFTILSSNTIVKDTGDTLFRGSVVLERNGLKFGIFGLTTPEVAYKTNPKNVENLTFTNPIETAKKEVESLKALGVDYIIALGHIGVDASSEYTSDKIAGAVPDIDLFIDGHSHTSMSLGKPVNESIKLVSHGDTVIASAGQYSENIGIVTIDKSKTITSDLIPFSNTILGDEKIDELISNINEKQNIILDEVVGVTPVRLEGEREFSRKQETNLGNLSADSILAATSADVAFTNGGGIRASINEGNITKKDLVTVFPFGNYVVTKNLTGTDLLKAMEVGTKSYPELAGGFPQVAGMTFSIDTSKPEGSRVINLMIANKPVDLNKTYVVATNDFIASGGDGYTMFDNKPIINEFGSLEEVLITYIQSNSNKKAVVEGRIAVIQQATSSPTATASSQSNPVIEVQTTGTYTVVEGDSLWKIAKKTTGDGNNWTAIYELNKDIIKNTNQIQIGQVLKLPIVQLQKAS